MDINKIGIAIIFGIVAVLAVLNVTGLDNVIKTEISQQNQSALCQQAKALTSMADCTVLDH